jgi:toxin HigB-1
MILGFKNNFAKAVFNGQLIKGFPNEIFTRSRYKLEILNSATTLNDLKNPPGNKLENLKGNREGQYSMRINDQWRVCFTWTEQGPDHVEIVDYH